jgi:small subunit ribosomal protein S6
MFVLDNQLVREDWKAAKAVVTSALEKHGGKVHTARRWDERRLAYPIAKRNRGTYLLTYFDIPGDGLPTLARDLELSEQVLRHLILQAVAVPEAEIELSQAEEAADFAVPAPPPDDAPDEEELAAIEREERRREERDSRRRDRDREREPAAEAPASDAKAEEGASAEAKPEEAKATEAKAEETKAPEAKAEETKPDEAETATAEPDGPAKEA